LAAFLRSSRERLSPEEAGLPITARRRTAGLRREEVAQIAGVGVTWYTWLEQGREIQVSTDYLERISLALRLDATERAHLFMLAHNRPPPATPAQSSRVTPALRRMLEAVAGPAYLATACLDVLAWNTTLSAVFGDLETLPPEERNMIWLVFASPSHRASIPNWEADARGMLARFRVEFGRHRNEPRFTELIERLKQASQEFRQWWPEQDVRRRITAAKRFEVPRFGTLELEQSAFLVEDSPELRLVVYSPVNEETARIVEQLGAGWRAERQRRAASSTARH
jgi:transcriptional regulator with XRE-family HTH domain